MEAAKTNYPSLATETFSHGKKHYFLDVKKAANNTHFLLITSSEKFEGQFHRRTIQLWEEDLAFFVEALSMILGQLAYGELSPPEVKMKPVKAPPGHEGASGGLTVRGKNCMRLERHH